MNIIEARNITRMFPVGDGEFYALKHVDIDIPAGKLTILKGRSGSGKTTLMNILSALMHRQREMSVSMDRCIRRWKMHRRNNCEEKKLGLSFRQLR